MKLHKLFILFFLALGLSLNNANIFAQDDDDDDDDDDQQMEEMDEEEWQRQMDELNAEKSNLTTRLAALNGEIDGLKSTSANKDKELEKCESDLYALVGTTKSGVADFRKKFEETEKKINGKVGTPADARKMYFDEISKDKARCLPEFQDRYASMKKKLEDWEVKPTEACYTVVKGDCLWKISKMKYGSPYYWPAIWDANKNGVANADALKNARHKKVTNPNLIYPGQCMKIPTLTDAQKKEAEMKSKKYRKTRKVKTTTDTKTDVKKDEKKDVKKDEKKDVKK
ncbi:MAG TPA: LysM peptidoglycan-binding domain-containing protein [Ignavibacteria bacterium]|nr:LysM peptidoglycan-binding domain-containing protein [Ignavibacteria bacterium]HMR00424.1 LysM peptidoglycan-binding domain-containing protein [Ignavibacteria bacterium]